MEKIRLIESRWGFRVQHEEVCFTEKGIISEWVNRASGSYKYVKECFDDFIKNGLPKFWGEEKYSIEPKKVLEEDYCDNREGF